MGSVLIAPLSTTFLTDIGDDPDISEEPSAQASVDLAGEVPVIADDDLEDALQAAGVEDDGVTAIVDDNAEARIVTLRASVAVVAPSCSWPCSSRAGSPGSRRPTRVPTPPAAAR